MKSRLSPSLELFSENILPLPVMNDYHLLIIAFKIRNNLLKNNIELKYINEIHSHGTRRVGNFHVVKNHVRAVALFKAGVLQKNFSGALTTNIMTPVLVPLGMFNTDGR
ncbi:CLUMA_CG011820, isoform A [Clunio marinus]|uniref:CLUMA_CG011820, isoform A n=1 Tax=Clunio marinus TaxID=568069 RepID=A0A1J1IDW5_9DIPT|nr:CLUMA_CG011820, isoform A [Clunio marinus]